jgi:hypothetical protein
MPLLNFSGYGRRVLRMLFGAGVTARSRASSVTADVQSTVAPAGKAGKRPGTVAGGRGKRVPQGKPHAGRERSRNGAALPLGGAGTPEPRGGPALRGDATPASPYIGLPSRAYWRSGVAERSPLNPGDLYRPRFAVTRDMQIATAGSCFAQHVGRALRGAGFKVLDAEALPDAVSDDVANRFGYRLFSGRYGNIYTTRQLAQLLDEVEGRFTPALPVWRRGDRFFDAQRPGVEPDGLDSEEQVLDHRQRHLARLRPVFAEADVFVFTFGLTEAWTHRVSGTVYPTAPGTIAGSYDPEIFAFHNYNTIEVLRDFERFRTALKAINPNVRFLVTVSPVPLTATATDAHVEVATCYSKAVLRAACGMLVARHEDIDYFPSFEIITSQNARGAYYEPNMRSVSPMGVETAMRLFLRAQGVDPAAPAPAPKKARGRPRQRTVADRSDDVQCEDALLDAFAR